MARTILATHSCGEGRASASPRLGSLPQGTRWPICYRGRPGVSHPPPGAIRTPALKRWDSTSGVLRMFLLAIDPYSSAFVHQYSGESANLLGNKSEPSQHLTPLPISTNPHSTHQPHSP